MADHRIFKYPLEITDLQIVSLPEGGRILSCGHDPQGQLCVWAVVDKAKSFGTQDLHRVVILGTGNPLQRDFDSYQFLGTVTDGMFVWHIFTQPCSASPNLSEATDAE